MTPPLDLTRPVQTRDGRAFDIVWHDEKWIFGLIGGDPNLYNRDTLDLINAPQKLRAWVTWHLINGRTEVLLHTGEIGYSHAIKDVSCIGRTAVEIDEGDGLAEKGENDA